MIQETLHEAVVHGNTEKVRELLDAGADVNAENIFGRTLLHFAAMNDCTELCAMLLEAGADVNATDDSGSTPLQLASPTTDLLRKHGAKEDKS